MDKKKIVIKDLGTKYNIPKWKVDDNIGLSPVEENDILEQYANQAHISWSGWMKYLFEKSTKNSDGFNYNSKESC